VAFTSDIPPLAGADATTSQFVFWCKQRVATGGSEANWNIVLMVAVHLLKATVQYNVGSCGRTRTRWRAGRADHYRFGGKGPLPRIEYGRIWRCVILCYLERF